MPLVVINSDGAVLTYADPADGKVLAAARRHLNGGHAAPIFHNPAVTSFLDEDGYAKALPVNKLATLLLHTMGQADPFYVGSLVITGGPTGRGDFAPLTEEQALNITETALLLDRQAS